MPYPHMPANVGPPPSGGLQSFAVDYTATGSEGTDFTVSLGSMVMADATYSVMTQSAGGASGDGTEASGVELMDIPKAGRAVGHFRVVIGAPLHVGDILEFLITGTVS
jgi:hypothetical protein